MHTTIGNTFINKLKNESFSVYSLANGLSNHDVQVLCQPNIIVPGDSNEFYFYRKISKHSLNEFQISLSYEAWENVFSSNDNDINTIFNDFLNTFGNFMPVFLKIKRSLYGILKPVNNWDRNIM